MKKTLSIILVLLITSCQKEIPGWPEGKGGQIVLNCMAVEGLAWHFELTESKNMDDQSHDFKEIKNAVIEIFSGTRLIEKINFDQKADGYYSNSHPLSGATYTVKVSAPGYETISATETVPVAPEISTAGFTSLSIDTIEDFGVFGSSRINLSFLNNLSKTEYYGLVMFFQNEGEISSDFVFKTKNKAFREASGGGADPEGYFYIYNHFTVFSGAELTNGMVDLEFLIDFFPHQEYSSVTIELYSLTETGYLMFKGRADIGLDFLSFLSTPKISKSNVSNGMGVFMAIGKSTYTFEY